MEYVIMNEVSLGTLEEIVSMKEYENPSRVIRTATVEDFHMMGVEIPSEFKEERDSKGRIIIRNY